MSGVEWNPIGIIRSPFREAAGTPIQPAFSAEAAGTVELLPEFGEGLKDLEGFEWIWLLYCFHEAAPSRLVVKPFLADMPRGIFATRAPVRPNPIGLSCARLVGIAGCSLSIVGVDVIDGTPLYDIKPYIPRFDAHPGSKAGWVETATGGVTRADGRFLEER